MKNTLRRLGMSAVLGLASLVATSGCASGTGSFFLSTVPPGATRQEATHANLGKKVEGIMNSKEGGHFIENGILYVDMPHYMQVGKEHGVKKLDKYNFQGIIESDSYSLHFVDKKGQRVDTPPQIITSSGYFSTADFGRFSIYNEDGTSKDVAELNAEVDVVAKAKGIIGEGDSVAITQENAYAGFAVPYSFLTGAANVFAVQDGKPFAARLSFPLNVAKIEALTGAAQDAKYVLVSIPRGNGKEVRSMVAVGDPMLAMTDPAHNMNMYHNSNAIFVGKNDWKIIRRTSSEVGGIFNDLTGVSDAIQESHASLDKLFRKNYLEQNQGKNMTPLQRAGKVVGEIGDVTGGLSGIKGDVETLNTPAKAAN
jgi:hypothetical protein